MTIPAFVNPTAGSADTAREALSHRAEFDVREVKPEALDVALGDSVRRGTTRVLVSGGDGTIAAAAQVLMDTPLELAVLPGGTLNHFARDLGIPTDPVAALETAVHGRVSAVDVATVNGRPFLNTFSAGAYVHFVRVREYLEQSFGYRIASAIAAMRILLQLRSIVVEMEINGQRRIYRTPLVFIGVGERELQAPLLGNRVPQGKRGLHVLVVRGRSRARLLALALNAVARGVKEAAQNPELESFIVERCTLRRKHHGHVAIDGELVKLDGELEFTLHRDALKVVVP